ncbi:MAG: hypothetical protein Q7S74_06795 [Nanoarchaeota archaeon]|nr:hypothetical protein [Nanoarchaeota archaeon]
MSRDYTLRGCVILLGIAGMLPCLSYARNLALLEVGERYAIQEYGDHKALLDETERQQWYQHLKFISNDKETKPSSETLKEYISQHG